MSDQSVCHWECEACGCVGSVRHDKHADVYSVINLLRKSHDSASPNCESGIGKMCVSKDTRETEGGRT